MLALGWIYIGDCPCSNGPWSKYTNNNYEGHLIRIHTRKPKFQIRRDGFTVRNGLDHLFDQAYEQVFANYISIG